MSLKVGETAYRITKGKHAGRLCWTTDDKIAEAKKARRNIEAQLVTENIPSYGLWGAEQVKVRPSHLVKVYSLAVWSDEVPALREEIEHLNFMVDEAQTQMCVGCCGGCDG